MAETCRWLICNKITIIHPSVFVDLFSYFVHLINAENMKHVEVRDNGYFDVVF